jgi:hypothetical protein
MRCMPVVRIVRGPKPSATIRVDKEIWEQYAEACRAGEVSRNEDLVEHMLHKIRAWKRHGGQADVSTDSSPR